MVTGIRRNIPWNGVCAIRGDGALPAAPSISKRSTSHPPWSDGGLTSVPEQALTPEIRFGSIFPGSERLIFQGHQKKSGERTQFSQECPGGLFFRSLFSTGPNNRAANKHRCRSQSYSQCPIARLRRQSGDTGTSVTQKYRKSINSYYRTKLALCAENYIPSQCAVVEG